MPAGGGSAVRAGRAYVELFADQSALAKGLRQAEYKLRRWGRNIGNIGRTLTKAGLAAASPFALSTRIIT